eukprot:CAMPEP_0204255156 /NCGR_PEP_ID=MMETSP0468-20130131/3028_1 /ASSEMBLY_ACC=CAM_ASM_000383 /TAXON_ID=2969 /ORGANISM="Oxyrrhis marina" /LENGTH=1018 /DNA_ID=CAMNT_0051229005 /DNA_START=89 /DNA_END=3145 /DNA_ORIENTATION=+
MKLACAASLCAVAAAIKLRAQTAESSQQTQMEEVWSAFESAITTHSNTNADESLRLEEAIAHLHHRGLPQGLKQALTEAKMQELTPMLAQTKVVSDDSDADAAQQHDADTSATADTTDTAETSDAAPTVNDVVARIFKIINGMIVNDQNKLVLKVFSCKKQQATFKSAYRTNRMNFNAESYKLQEALSTEKLGQLEQFEASVRLRKLIPSRNTLKKRCRADIRELQAQFKRISYDYTLARKIADGTSCAKKAPTSFLQTCIRMTEDGAKEGFVQFQEGTAEAGVVSLLQTDTARKAVHRGLVDVVGHDKLGAPPAEILFQVSSRQQKEASSWLHSEAANAEDADEALSEEADELAHRDTDFNDYFFQDADFEDETGVEDEPFRPTEYDSEINAAVSDAIAKIDQESTASDRDTSDADAPPNGWINQAALDHASKELAMIQAAELGLLSAPNLTNVSLPFQNMENSKAKQSAKFFCTVASNPNCQQFRDKLEMIVAELLAEKQHVQFLLSTTRSECKKQITELDSQIATMNGKKSDGARIEAQGSADKSNSQVSISAIEKEGRDLLKSAWKQSNDCDSELKSLRNTVCGSKKLKQEVITIESKQSGKDKLVINDCSVGDWQPGECMDSQVARMLEQRGIYDASQAQKLGAQYKNLLHPCGVGGGVQWFLRDKVSPPQTPNHGADCPPLRLKTNCNDFECPIDCKLGDWEGWSACSKSCDGGLKRRVRPVVTYPQWDGDECDDTKDEETCNALSCDRPCLLTRWSRWRQCTRACEGGIRWRSRQIRRKASGDGKCPRTFSKARYQRQTCNNSPCPMDVVCVAKMDLVIGIDASGSMGTYGWKAQRQALLNLINRMQLSRTSGILLGALKFAYRVTILAQLTDDKKALIKAVTDTKFDAWTTNIGGAFRVMKTMLQFGRRDAPSVCMLWTDGRPSRPSSRYDAALGARDLRSSCRVMVVTMRPAVPKSYVAPWVSHPKAQNVMVVRDPRDMTKKVMQVNTFVCGKIQRFLDWTSTTTKAAR